MKAIFFELEDSDQEYLADVLQDEGSALLLLARTQVKQGEFTPMPTASAGKPWVGQLGHELTTEEWPGRNSRSACQVGGDPLDLGWLCGAHLRKCLPFY